MVAKPGNDPVLARLLEQAPGLPEFLYADRKAVSRGELNEVVARFRKRRRRILLLSWPGPLVLAANAAFLWAYGPPGWQSLLALANLAMALGTAVLFGYQLGESKSRLRELEYWARSRGES